MTMNRETRGFMMFRGVGQKTYQKARRFIETNEELRDKLYISYYGYTMDISMVILPEDQRRKSFRESLKDLSDLISMEMKNN